MTRATSFRPLLYVGFFSKYRAILPSAFRFVKQGSLNRFDFGPPPSIIRVLERCNLGNTKGRAGKSFVLDADVSR
ncbi:MAG: hypothetical protein PVG25_01675 [Anaerolineae bacterium]